MSNPLVEETLVIKPEEKEELEWLTQRESCDACSAQSYYVVAFKSGTLYFCRHHYLKHQELFFDQAEDIVDESELLF